MPRTGDPLVDYPHLAEVIADRITDWRERRLCLCGCGQEIVITRELKPPAYFKRGHVWTVYKQAGIKTNFRKTCAGPGDRARHDRECVTTLGVAYELDEYLRQHDLTCAEFGRRHGFCGNYLTSIRRRTRKRISKVKMIQIMEAMGKEVHSSLREQSGKVEIECVWCGEIFVAYKHARTCSDNCRRARYHWEHFGGKSAAELELAREYGV